MLRVKKGCANKARGYIKAKILTDNLSTLPTDFTYEEGTYLGYQDIEDGVYTVRTYNYSPDTLIKDLSLKSKSGLTEIEVYRLGAEIMSFGSCDDLKRVRFERFRKKTLKNISDLFFNCQQLEYIYGLDELDVSMVVDINSAFTRLINLKEPLNLSTWDVSNNQFFPSYNNYPFDNVDFMMNWNMGKYSTSIPYFGEHSKIKRLDFSNNNLHLMSAFSMFSNMHYLETINLNNVNFDSVTDIQAMFYNDESLEILDLSMVNSVIDNAKYAFKGCTNLILLDLSHIDLENADCEGMFDGCPNLQAYPKMDYCNAATKLKVKEAYDNRIL